jgi:hypothetical protein
MKPALYAFLWICLIACSPYKKVTVSMSDRLTKRWKGATEQAVNASVGSYKQRAILPDGFLLRFDYSYISIPQQKKSNDFQVKASNQPSSPMTPLSNDSYYNDHRSADDSVIIRMDFYFDKSRHVQYVQATGFPDSVYYIKRR